MEIVLTIILAILAVGLFIYSMFLFHEKGPIPTTLYILAKPEDRKKMKTKAEYRFTGIAMLALAIIFFLLTIEIIFSIDWMSKIVIGISIILAVYVLVYSIREVTRRD